MIGGRSWRGAHLYTVGHSTRTLDELVGLLRTFEVTVLADIRTIPKSRHNPQFNGDTLRERIPETAVAITDRAEPREHWA